MDRFTTVVFAKDQLDRLIQSLRKQGYHVIAPRMRDAALVLDEITFASDLPVGWTQDLDAGKCRLRKRDDSAYFGYVVGMASWKRFFFPPRLKMFSIRRQDGNGYAFEATAPQPPKYAMLGVRACDLAALQVHDRVFKSSAADPYYAAARQQAFIIAVNCVEPGGTCFCASMGTGPECRKGYDLVLTELDESFTAQAGSPRGQAVLDGLDARAADSNTCQLVSLMMRTAGEHMGRSLHTDGLTDMLLTRPHHSRWQEISRRCMACTNCTMVCPTCFCHNVEDSTDLSGDLAERWRTWGSCFTLEFSYHTGGFNRSSISGRYRQWMTHKLAGYQEQFGCRGCVGCGRCITWCPVGIDLTREANLMIEMYDRSREVRKEQAFEEVGS